MVLFGVVVVALLVFGWFLGFYLIIMLCFLPFNDDLGIPPTWRPHSWKKNQKWPHFIGKDEVIQAIFMVGTQRSLTSCEVPSAKHAVVRYDYGQRVIGCKAWQAVENSLSTALKPCTESTFMMRGGQNQS